MEKRRELVRRADVDALIDGHRWHRVYAPVEYCLHSARRVVILRGRRSIEAVVFEVRREIANVDNRWMHARPNSTQSKVIKKSGKDWFLPTKRTSALTKRAKSRFLSRPVPAFWPRSTSNRDVGQFSGCLQARGLVDPACRPETARRAALLKPIDGEAESSEGGRLAYSERIDISGPGISGTSYIDRYYRGAKCDHVAHIR